MKTICRHLFYFVCIIIVISCSHQPQKNVEVVVKENPEDEINYPKDIEHVKDFLQAKLKSVVIDVIEGESAGIWKFSIQRNDSSTIFSYNVLPDTLSRKSYNNYLNRVMLQSCLVDNHASKTILYKNLFFTPGCGNVADSEVKVVKAFYDCLINHGAVETDKAFAVMRD